MLDSPYVRRVAIALQLLGLPFEHRALSVFRTFDQFRAINPVVKAPTLVCDDGTVLMDSSLILDYAETLAAPRSLLPRWTRCATGGAAYDRAGAGRVRKERAALLRAQSAAGEATRALGGPRSRPDARGVRGARGRAREAPQRAAGQRIDAADADDGRQPGISPNELSPARSRMRRIHACASCRHGQSNCRSSSRRRTGTAPSGPRELNRAHGSTLIRMLRILTPPG